MLDFLNFNKQKYFKCPQESRAINNVFFFFHTCIALKKLFNNKRMYKRDTRSLTLIFIAFLQRDN